MEKVTLNKLNQLLAKQRKRINKGEDTYLSINFNTRDMYSSLLKENDGCIEFSHNIEYFRTVTHPNDLQRFEKKDFIRYKDYHEDPYFLAVVFNLKVILECNLSISDELLEKLFRKNYEWIMGTDELVKTETFADAKKLLNGLIAKALPYPWFKVQDTLVSKTTSAKERGKLLIELRNKQFRIVQDFAPAKSKYNSKDLTKLNKNADGEIRYKTQKPANEFLKSEFGINTKRERTVACLNAILEELRQMDKAKPTQKELSLLSNVSERTIRTCWKTLIWVND